MADPKRIPVVNRIDIGAVVQGISGSLYTISERPEADICSVRLSLAE
jgi:hypothetical protein